jgi:CBS domain-containing protein
MKLEAILRIKDSGVVSVPISSTVLDGVKTMHAKRVGSVTVESEDGDLIGILTERDVLRFCAENGGEIRNAPIDRAMTTNLIIGTPDMSLDEAMTLMTENRFRHLPIMEGQRACGLVSIGDLVKARLEDVTVEAKFLRDYINT